MNFDGVKIVVIDGYEYVIDDPEFKKEQIQKKYKYFLKRSNIPEFYWDIEFENYVGTNSLESLKKAKYYSQHCFEEKFSHIHLYLCGINTSQKTAVACNIGKQCIRNGYEVKFVLASTLIDKLMKIQGFTINAEIDSYIKDLKKADVLIIDDAFDIMKSLMWKNIESNSLIITAWDSFLRDVIVSDTKVIMTSNIGIENIEQKFGESLKQLIDRNFICLDFYDSVMETRKKKFEGLFDNL